METAKRVRGAVRSCLGQSETRFVRQSFCADIAGMSVEGGALLRGRVVEVMGVGLIQ